MLETYARKNSAKFLIVDGPEVWNLAPPMSEFKFACPVCGQHITADSSAAHSELSCPTCFRKIVVPSAPLGASKYILSAAQAQAERPLTPGAEAQELTLAPPKSLPRKVGWIAACLLAIAAAGAVLYAFCDRVFRPGKPAPVALAPVTASNVTTTAAADASKAALAAASNVNWTLDLAGLGVPGSGVVGRIHGNPFVCDRATLQDGVLSFRTGRWGPPALALSIALPLAPGESVAGKSIVVTTNRPHSPAALPEVVLRWREQAPSPVSLSLKEGYAMRLEFGAFETGHIGGKIYVCTPDPWQSVIAGGFEAELRHRPQPKPQPQTFGLQQ